MSSNDTDDRTGLDILRDRILRILPSPPIMETMGMEIVHAEKGLVRFMATPDKRHLNSQKLIQGGFAASVLDAAAGCAVQTLLEARTRLLTVDLNVKFFRAIQADRGRLSCEGRVLHISHRIGAAQGSLVDEQDRCYAHATASFMLLR